MHGKLTARKTLLYIFSISWIHRTTCCFSFMDYVVRQRSNFNRALIGSEVTINVVNVYNMRGVETNLMHGLVAFVFFGLLGFLQIRYPENPTPFQHHPKTTLLSITSFLLYCSGFWVKLKFKG